MKPWGWPTGKSPWSQNSVTDDVERYQRPDPPGVTRHLDFIIGEMGRHWGILNKEVFLSIFKNVIYFIYFKTFTLVTLRRKDHKESRKEVWKHDWEAVYSYSDVQEQFLAGTVVLKMDRLGQWLGSISEDLMSLLVLPLALGITPGSTFLLQRQSNPPLKFHVIQCRKSTTSWKPPVDLLKEGPCKDDTDKLIQ